MLYRTFLIAVLLIWAVPYVQGFPQIANASFEDPFVAGTDGWSGPIPGWEVDPGRSGNGAGGTNCVAWQGSFAGLYDNGVLADGAQVGGIYQGRMDVAEPTRSYLAPVRIYQMVPGFRKGRRYVLRYNENARALAPNATPKPALDAYAQAYGMVRLNGQVIDPEHAVVPLEANGSFTLPFTERVCAVFEAPEDGAYLLEFLGHNHVWLDSTWLFDNLRFDQINPDPNTAPLIEPMEEQKTYPGQKLQFTVVAIDTNEPPQTLTFSLGNQAPAGATIDPQTGVFEWAPESTERGTQQVSIVVSDNGSPTLSSSVNVTISLLETPELKISATRPHVLSWTGLANTKWQLEASDFLVAPEWKPIGEPVTINEEAQAEIMDAESTAFEQRFYRLRQLD